MTTRRLNHRLHPDLVNRLEQLRDAQKLSMTDLLSNAVDALEREIYLPETLLERVEKLENLVGSIIKKLEVLDDKIPSAEKIKYFFQVMEKQLVAHDEAEQARFERQAGSRNFY
ncbi:hypothetical protein [Geomonas anaerohicana]|uniref:Uncharacterized protein n=1 Tax=Geomonas anaerohicana TaxID=2798583 RepID=A0ABS0YC88_9BACT|nr:hypothetical protein [Geomonas anaerohicana]MBJ6749920.1 hypothetical protein [Geomonas anaerohicana]